MYYTGDPQNGWIFVKGAGNSSTKGYALNWQTTGPFAAFICDGATRLTAFTSTGITSPGWHHLAAVYDRDANLTLYLDGRQDGTPVDISAFSATDISNSENACIGAGCGGSPIKAQLDHMQIYSYARTPAQIAWDYNRGKPIGWWKLDDGQGLTARDSSGNNNYGTLASMTPATDWVAGKFGKALDFDGSNDNVFTASTSFIANGNEPHSVTAWIYPRIVSSNKSIYSFGEFDDLNYNTMLGINSSGNLVWNCNGFFSFNSCTIFDSGLAISPNQWHFVSFARTASDITFRVDDRISTVSSAGNGPITPDRHMIGISYLNGNPNNTYFNGLIDDVRVYNYALTPAQVLEVYNYRAIRYGP